MTPETLIKDEATDEEIENSMEVGFLVEEVSIDGLCGVY